MKISVVDCELTGKGNCPDKFDFLRTLKEFNPTFVNYEDEQKKERFDNEIDTAVVFISNEVNHWEFFQAVYALRPDGFLFQEVPNGVIVYLAWEGTEEDEDE